MLPVAGDMTRLELCFLVPLQCRTESVAGERGPGGTELPGDLVDPGKQLGIHRHLYGWHSYDDSYGHGYVASAPVSTSLPMASAYARAAEQGLAFELEEIGVYTGGVRKPA